MKQRQFLTRLTASALLALGLGVASCGPKKPLPEIKVGLIAELTGDIPVVGASCKNAAEMAVAEIAEAGGIEVGGKKYALRLVIEDSNAKADQAAQAAQRLVSQEDVVAIVGPNASLGAIPAAQAAEAAKVPLITPWSTNPKATLDEAGAPKKWVFRTCFTDAFQGRVLAKFAIDFMHATKAGVLYDATSEAPRGQAEVFRKDFEAAGGKVVAFETYKTGDKDFGAQLGKIKAAGPDIVFLPAYYNDVPEQMKAARALGLTVPFLGSDNWSSPQLIKQAGSIVEGSFFCNHYSPETRNDTVARFVAQYKKRFAGSVPDDVAALTYDSFELLVQAIKTATKIDRTAVRDALAKVTDFEGVTGKMKFTPGSGDPAKSAVMMKIQDGKIVFVTNIDP